MTKHDQKVVSQQHSVQTRDIAFAVCLKVQKDHAFSNLLLPAVLEKSSCTAHEKAYITDLVYGTLRWQGFCDAVIAANMKRSLSQLDTPVLIILRLATYQALFMATPDYAVASTYVLLAKKQGLSRQAKFINAVLRKIVMRSRQEWESILVSRIPKDHSNERLAVRYSHPLWIVNKLSESVNYTNQRLQQEKNTPLLSLPDILAMDNQPPTVSLALRPGILSEKDLRQQVPHRAEIQKGEWSPYAYHVKGISPNLLPGITNGSIGVEDEGSQLAALTLACAPLPVPMHEDRWLDLCAGPGGKTAILASIARQRGITVTANEISAHRADLVRQNIRQLRETITQIIVRDGRDYSPEKDGLFDRILVDAPCSGLGVLRRRPEARWTKTEEDVYELTLLQQQLLETAITLLKPGGLLAYVTCSPVLEETVTVVDSVCHCHQQIERYDTVQALHRVCPHIPVASHGDVQLFTEPHHTDMMFISLLTRHA